MDTVKKIPLGTLLKERYLKNFNKADVSEKLTEVILSLAGKDLDWIIVEGENVGVVDFIESFAGEEQLTVAKINGNWTGYSNSFYLSLSGRLPVITAGIPKADIYIKADGQIVAVTPQS